MARPGRPGRAIPGPGISELRSIGVAAAAKEHHLLPHNIVSHCRVRSRSRRQPWWAYPVGGGEGSRCGETQQHQKSSTCEHGRDTGLR